MICEGEGSEHGDEGIGSRSRVGVFGRPLFAVMSITAVSVAQRRKGDRLLFVTVPGSSSGISTPRSGIDDCCGCGVDVGGGEEETKLTTSLCAEDSSISGKSNTSSLPPPSHR